MTHPLTLIALVLLISAYAVWKWRQTELAKFRRDVQIGYLVSFRHRGNLVTGEVIGCGVDYVIIKTPTTTHKRSRSEIWWV